MWQNDKPWWNGYGEPTSTNIGVAFHHVFSGNLSANLYGGWGEESYEGDSIKSTLVGLNFDYQPVKNFHIQPEVYHVDQSDSYNDIDSKYTGFLVRIKRDF